MNTSTASANASGTPKIQSPSPISEASMAAMSAVPRTKPPRTSHARRPARSIAGRVPGEHNARIHAHNRAPSRSTK
jgi:hypothetical protein